MTRGCPVLQAAHNHQHQIVTMAARADWRHSCHSSSGGTSSDMAQLITSEHPAQKHDSKACFGSVTTVITSHNIKFMSNRNRGRPSTIHFLLCP
jgi:hypothetical protein